MSKATKLRSRVRNNDDVGPDVDNNDNVSNDFNRKNSGYNISDNDDTTTETMITLLMMSVTTTASITTSERTTTLANHDIKQENVLNMTFPLQKRPLTCYFLS